MPGFMTAARPMIRAVGLGAALVLGLAFPAASAEEGRDRALIRLGEQSDCSGKPLGYQPGYFSPDDPASGVFWCRRDERYAADGRFIIVVVDRHPTRRLECPPVIVAINEPSAVRVLRDQTLPLSDFVVRHEPWRKGPGGQSTAGPIVDAVDDGVGEQWVCHRGAWLVRVYH